jgi:release factor glutamine methyltransferase
MRTTIEEALAATIGDLTEAGIPDAVGDARRLMAFALDITPDRLTLVQKDAITPAGLGALDAAIKARLERKPVSHILGVREFWGRSFKVTPDVLDPRPETETLIETALAQPFSRVLDLGTGSGCILLTLYRPAGNGLAGT